MKPIPTAVIGVGHLGRIHARLLQSLNDALLLAVVDPDSRACNVLAEELRVRSAPDVSDVLDNIDAAIVAAPTSLHFPIVRQLLEAGIHVLVEKPVTTHSQQADHIWRLARDNGLILQVGHVERFNPAWQSAKSWLHAPRYIEAVRQNGYTFRSTDVSVVLDLMIHDLDLILSIVDGPVTRLDAVGAAVFGPYEDFAHATLEFQDGCVAHLSASRISPRMEREMRITTSQTNVTVDFAQRQVNLMSVNPALRKLDVHQLPAERREEIRNRLFDDWLPVRTLPVATTNPLLEEQRDFLSSIRSRSRPEVNGHDGRCALQLAEQILQAIRLRTWNRSEGNEMAQSIPFWPAADSHVGYVPRKAG